MMVLTILQKLLQIGVLIYSSFLINKSLAKKTPNKHHIPPKKISGGRNGVMPTPLTSPPPSFFLYVRKDIYSYSFIFLCLCTYMYFVSVISLNKGRCRQLCGQQVYGDPPPRVGGDQWGTGLCGLSADGRV